MTETAIRPALTTEEWERFWSNGKSSPLIADIQRELVAKAKSGDALAAAALALYISSGGFNWGDVDILRQVAARFKSAPEPEGLFTPVSKRFESLADRIEALLPPLPE